ncbi:MAG: hypothetical protein WC476_08615 [Phycisphaerae bacterium]|jgi:hypothetical protein
MRTRNAKLKTQNYRFSFLASRHSGSVLVLVVVSLVILAALGVGLLKIAYGVRHEAVMLKNEAVAMLAAEAGYERAMFWMSQQQDMLSALQNDAPGTTGAIQFTDGGCDYSIEFYTFVGSRPVYKVISNGHSGAFDRTVEVEVIQALSGWDMGMCRVPNGTTSTLAVNYVDGEILDIPIHINKLDESWSDQRDIYISGSPQFLREVAMGESRYTTGGSDKYSSVIDLFEGGIYFDQPDSRITDEAAIQTKIDRFANSTAAAYKYTPTASTSVSTPRYPAVQLEFFVDPADGVGKVRITNNCTVDAAPAGYYDYEIVPGSGGTSYRKYDTYDYHFKRTSYSSDVQIVPLTNTYVSQSIGTVQSEPGGQIYVKGNIVIGSSNYVDMVIQGKMTVVAARTADGKGGHIWIADNIVVDGPHDANGLPTEDNPNILGLIAQGVVKVINPTNGPSSSPSGLTYQPIGITKSGRPATERYLPDPVIVEAAITVGGGGWGAEEVYNPGRREYSSPQDDLVVRGTITEAVRGPVGITGSDGFIKKYYLDERLLEGVLPGDMWLRGKYIPAPAGWYDYRPSE